MILCAVSCAFLWSLARADYLESKTSHIKGVGTFYPGWAFKSHSRNGGLGYPVIPLDGYPTYNMSRSTSAYFLGNDTGLNSVAELAAEAKFGIIGIGWQLRMRESDWQHLEQWEVETAKALKAINPDAKVLVSRNSEVGTAVWDHVRTVLVPPGPAQFPGMWVIGQTGGSQCALGKVCNETWDCDNCGPNSTTAVPYGKLFFNWTSAEFIDWWMTAHIGSGISDATFDGVYFDCSCGAPPGVPSSDLVGFMAAAQKGFDRHLPVLQMVRKMSIAWNGEHVQKGSCEGDMKRLLEAYEYGEANETLQLIYDNNPDNFQQTLAAFLIMRGEFALFQFGVIGPYECASVPCGTRDSPASGYGPYVWNKALDADYGVPAGKAVEESAGVWTRQWTKAKVQLDCNAWTAAIFDYVERISV